VSRRSATPLVITVVVLIGAALLILYYGRPLLDAMKSLHGGGGH
jgi:hypothetical protein